ncbi:MAG: GTPase HflX, partial [Alphaproteobacteria bacterium]
LEEVLEADLIIHVRDIAHGETAAQKADVLDVLKGLGVSEDKMESMIEVLNKSDLLDAGDALALAEETSRQEGAVLISAITGEGLDDFHVLVDKRLSAGFRHYALQLRPEDGAARAYLHKSAKVVDEATADDGSTHITAQMDEATRGRFDKNWPTVRVREIPS